MSPIHQKGIHVQLLKDRWVCHVGDRKLAVKPNQCMQGGAKMLYEVSFLRDEPQNESIYEYSPEESIPK